MWYDDILEEVSSPETLRLRSLSVRAITQGMYDDGARPVSYTHLTLPTKLEV